MSLVELLATVKLAASRSEATRLVKSGGVYVNNVRAADEQARLTRVGCDRRAGDRAAERAQAISTSSNASIQVDRADLRIAAASQPSVAVAKKSSEG